MNDVLQIMMKELERSLIELGRLRVSHAELLAAAKEAITLIDGRIWAKEKMKLQAAIAAAEEQAP